jgi:hypothetical protein
MTPQSSELRCNDDILLGLLFNPETSLKLLVAFSLGLLFNPEDVGNMFFRNLGSILTDYTALHLITTAAGTFAASAPSPVRL